MFIINIFIKKGRPENRTQAGCAQDSYHTTRSVVLADMIEVTFCSNDLKIYRSFIKLT